MTSGQRKAHKVIWLVLAVIIPFFMVATIRGLDFNASNNTGEFKDSRTQVDIKMISDVIHNSAENELIKVNVYSNSLEIMLKKPLKSSSSTIYAVDSKSKKRHFIGLLDAVGIYFFQSHKDIESLLVVDGLKNELITKLKL